MTGKRIIGVVATLGAAAFLAGCEGSDFQPFKKADASETTTRTATQTLRTVERDVESPEVFLAREQGLWDGRLSLGGIWVAHPDVIDPERAVIRNVRTGDSVVGALFRREREFPGPRIQVSSDAARDLGLIAGQPVELEIVALRSEKVELGPAPQDLDTETQPLGSPGDVEATPLDPSKSLDDPIEAAAAAIEQAETGGAMAMPQSTGEEPVMIGTTAEDGTIAPAEPQTAEVKPARKGLFALRKPIVEIATFPTRERAEQAVGDLRRIDISARVSTDNSSGEPVYRVLYGPVSDRSERSAAIITAKASGYTNAKPVAE
ncbi:SPOR domain-containing protein [Parasulfitobacter algicola]|uniref:SPOR domain-containing protein n=1 Tax=Parasulfitobacter algicola TaxID=2614809 RepID=A0ABX2J059_9RHOB|nr:SPOR domain-containing protein [Sulfitobacter algicola]NSX56454.1 SPOR domain-containing protein [Sulfitobacter algicola]